jgi:NMD protein affecting ribosome stability and mRNA decay
MEPFCYKCGKLEKENTLLIDNLCPNCYKTLHPLLKFPYPLEIKLCRKCYRIFINNRWITPPEPDIEDILDYAIKESLPYQISKNPQTTLEIIPKLGDNLDLIQSISSFELEIRSTGRAHESLQEYNEIYNTQKVKLKFTVCPYCMSLDRGEYQAVLHVLATGRNLTEWEIDQTYSLVGNEVEKMINVDFLAYISKLTSKKGKITFYIGSERFARLIASILHFNLGGSLKETYKSGFQRIPKEVKRNKLYISLYLPPYTLGCLLLLGNLPLYVTKIQSKYAAVINLNTYDHAKIPQKQLEDAQILKWSSDLRSYLYLSQTDQLIQLLDLENYQLFELSKSLLYNNLKVGDNLKGFELNGQILIIPEKKKA